jgi:hypothetical protein
MANVRRRKIPDGMTSQESQRSELLPPENSLSKNSLSHVLCLCSPDGIITSSVNANTYGDAAAAGLFCKLSSSQTPKLIKTQNTGSILPSTICQGASCSSYTFLIQFSRVFKAFSNLLWVRMCSKTTWVVSSILAIK